EVELAVADKISNRHGPGSGAGGIALRGLESAVPLAQQNADRVRGEIGHCKVELAVTDEVPDRHRKGTPADNVVLGGALGGLEGAVAIAQQDTQCVRAGVGNGKVGMTVAVEVPHRYSIGK